MKSESVIYDGRVVPKQGFRAFIYGINGEIKLANSWDEFQENIGSSLWYTTKEQAKRAADKIEPKPTKKKG